MAYFINSYQTVWLPFKSAVNVYAATEASWQEQVQLADPLNFVTGVAYTGTGEVPPNLIAQFNTPANYGELLAYPVNVIIQNDGGVGVWQPSYVGQELSPDLAIAVFSRDELQNQGVNSNMTITFNIG
jgi:hypothetical protein